MRLTLIALSASYCVDALLAISTSTKASSHSCEAARRSVMTAVSGRTALAAAHRPRATIICRDGFFDSVTGQCNACVMHVHCHRVASYPTVLFSWIRWQSPGTPALPWRWVCSTHVHVHVQVSEPKYYPKSFGTADTSRNPRDSIPLDAVPRAL